MRQLVVDIETVGVDFDSLAESQQEYLLRSAMKEKDEVRRNELIKEAKGLLAIFPQTGKCIVIGMYDVQNNKPIVYFESETPEEGTFESTGALYRALSEKQMLERFWEVAACIDQLITFNGRGFDIPFLLFRSAVNRVKPSKNFMQYRYDLKSHIDLLEVFSLFGTVKRFNLDSYCHALGIPSPKGKEINGHNVHEFYARGDIRRIAEYCTDDIIATYRLYEIWRDYFNVS